MAIGCVPVYGFHWLLVLGICLPLRLDAPVAYLAANVSNPFFAPFLLFCEVQIGSLVLAGHSLAIAPRALADRGPGALAAETAVGTAIFAPAMALIFGAMAYALTALVRLRAKNGS